MAEPLFTVVGACTANSAKIFAVFDHAIPEAQLKFRVDGSREKIVRKLVYPALPFYLCNFEIKDLPSSFHGTEIEYTVSGNGPASFRLLPAGRPLRIALVSCNNAFEILQKKRRYRLWTELKEQINAGNVDLVIHAGDQVYADGIRLRYRVRNRLFDPLEESQVEEITTKYRKLYVDTWRAPEVASVLSSSPSLFIWDDHDIYDGYGSHEDDLEPISQLLFRAAQKAFLEFQAIHNPSPLTAGSATFAVNQGKTAILVLDERSHRSWVDQRILGDAQFQEIENWLKQHSGNSLENLYIVSPTPILYVPVAAYLKLIQIIGWKGPLTEDLRDCWTAPNNQRECRQLLDLLTGFQIHSPATKIHILSGDVHVAAFGKIEKEKGQSGTINQVISSGIGSLPPIGISGIILRSITEENVELTGTGFHGTLYRFPETGDFVLAKRNFAIVSSERNALELTYFVEENDGITPIHCSL